MLCASQIRISTVPNAMCGRTDHQTCVYSTTELVATRSSRYSRNARHDPKWSGTPQRGNDLVKVWVRIECRPEFSPSTNGELADSASSSGSTGRRRSQTAIARSASRIPTWTCSEKVALRRATQRSPSTTRR